MIGESTAVPLIRTKLHRSRVSDDLVLRRHLLDRLNQSLGRKLTLVCAPAGFGKTTLVVSWLDSCHRTSAWLSLDESDNQLLLLLSYLVSAIRSLFPQACQDSLESLQSPQTPPPELDAHVSQRAVRAASSVPPEIHRLRQRNPRASPPKNRRRPVGKAISLHLIMENTRQCAHSKRANRSRFKRNEVTSSSATH
jgi:hypothetical protein